MKNLFELAEIHIEENYNRMLEDLKTLAAIPAPSHDEGLRSQWTKKYLEDMGAQGVYIDEALNVVYPYYGESTDKLTVFLTHIDVVFPDKTPLPITEDDDHIYGPGIGDNSTSVMCMMEMIRFMMKNDVKPKEGFLFVCNSCEEGLGNLKGIKQIMKDYEGKIKEVVAIDGGRFGGFLNDAVGSKRYRVTIKTEGGHSYGAFGNHNAIHYLASMINTLYTVKVPEIGKTTYNVGLIEGGTSINTIAQKAEMMYEYRSNEKEALEIMDKMFQSVIETYQNMGVEVVCELLGDRPCRGEVDTTDLENRVRDVAREIFDMEFSTHAGSTDCNAPLSMGIPAVCIAAYEGKGAHTREEFIYKHSMHKGLRFLAKFFLSYCE